MPNNRVTIEDQDYEEFLREDDDPLAAQLNRQQRTPAKASPFELVNRKLEDRLEDTSWLWTMLRGFPGVRDWRVISDALFCLTTFPIGIAAFIVAVVGFVTGVALSWLGIGFAILAWTFALLLWGTQIERSRVRSFLNVDVPDTAHWSNTRGNVVARTWQIVRSPQVWRDFLYLGLLFPIGMVELGLVVWPLQFFFSPLMYFLFGGVFQQNVWGINITNGFMALVILLMGVVSLAIAPLLIHGATKLHGQLAVMLLGTTQEEVLSGRVEELTESRSAVMRAMHMERRRIERDLHDGAQQQLVALAMDLGRAREKMESDPDGAREIIDSSHERAKRVMTEMRELVRGIHPAVLTDRGLDAAVSAVAGRSPIPVDVAVHVHERLSEEVEGTAYFVVVEALTNIAKHSGATRARVSIQRDGNWLRITVTDNGRGGADPSVGSGMQGLRDRIHALEGTFAYTSPVGQGTRIIVEIPCELSLPKMLLSSGKD